MEEHDLSRRERRKLLREEKRQENLGKQKSKDISKWVLGFITIAVILAGIYWIWKDSSKPLSGEEVAEMGREHVTDIAGVEYNSNPPTSGPHFAVWAKSGVYDRLLSDGYLIHSLEHGYVVISYDCTKNLVPSAYFLVPNALAHDEPAKESSDSGELLKHLKYDPEGDASWFTPENPPEVEVELPEEFKSDSCKSLVSELTRFTKVAERVIVAPRLDMETPIALTAWGRIMKLSSVDKGNIEYFIKSFHNKGPEKTME